MALHVGFWFVGIFQLWRNLKGLNTWIHLILYYALLFIYIIIEYIISNLCNIYKIFYNSNVLIK